MESIDTMQEICKKQEKQLDTDFHAIQELGEKIASLERNILIKDAQLIAQEQEITDLKAQLTDAEGDDIASLKFQIVSLNTMIKNLEGIMKDKEIEIASLKLQNEEAVKAYTSQIAKLEAELLEYQKDFDARR